MLTVKNLTITLPYGFLHLKKKTVIDNLSFSIKKNTVTLLRWNNGSGKSTLIRTLLWLHSHTGQILFFNNKKYTDCYERLGYSLQPHPLVPLMTAIEHLIFCGADKALAHDLLSQVWLTHAKDILSKKYSTWMKKRLSLAISLINNPEFLIRDEPLNWLDTPWRELVMKLIKKLQSEGKTILIASHLVEKGDYGEIALTL